MDATLLHTPMEATLLLTPQQERVFNSPTTPRRGPTHLEEGANEFIPFTITSQEEAIQDLAANVLSSPIKTPPPSPFRTPPRRLSPPSPMSPESPIQRRHSNYYSIPSTRRAPLTQITVDAKNQMLRAQLRSGEKKQAELTMDELLSLSTRVTIRHPKREITYPFPKKPLTFTSPFYHEKRQPPEKRKPFFSFPNKFEML